MYTSLHLENTNSMTVLWEDADMKSVWEQTWEYTDFPSLERDVTTNVLIGGGVAGVLCAYFLHQAGIPCWQKKK